MRDDRPLHVLFSRAATLLGIPLLDAEPNYPADPKLRALRVQGALPPVDEAHRDTCPVWLEAGRGLLGGREIVIRACVLAKRREYWTIVEGRTPKAFRAAYDAWERGREAEAAFRAHVEVSS